MTTKSTHICSWYCFINDMNTNMLPHCIKYIFFMTYKTINNMRASASLHTRPSLSYRACPILYKTTSIAVKWKMKFKFKRLPFFHAPGLNSSSFLLWTADGDMESLLYWHVGFCLFLALPYHWLNVILQTYYRIWKWELQHMLAYW